MFTKVSKNQLITARLYGQDGSEMDLYLHPDMTIWDVADVAIRYGGMDEDSNVQVLVGAKPFGQVVRVTGESGYTDVHISFLEETV